MKTLAKNNDIEDWVKLNILLTIL